MLFRSEEFRAALAIRPYWHRLAYSAATSLMQLGERDKAVSLMEQMRSVIPDSVFTVVLGAELARQAGGVDEAERRLSHYLAQARPTIAANLARLALANVYRAQDRPAAAAQAYREVITADPMNWAAWGQLYQLRRAGGDTARAAGIANYLQGMGVDPMAWAVPDSGAD
mgnify:CR=1 FL=1